MRKLEGVRINPNLFHDDILIRNDLEFYIPQLCSFMLFGELEAVEEFLSVLCRACYASYSFAHRIIWFLKSMIFPMNPYNKKIREILHLIQTIFKSESKGEELSRFNVPGSEQYLNYYQNKSLDDFILINIFKSYSYETNNEEDINLQTIKQIDLNDINLSSFLSTIHFFDNLCNICDRLRFIESKFDREIELKKELNKINDVLPCNVYIPFTASKIKNYVIAHIPVNEVKIYTTKERTPIMITAECFRLDEINYNQSKKVQLIDDKLLNAHKKNKGIGNENDYLIESDISISKPLAINTEEQNILKDKLHNVIKVSTDEKEFKEMISLEEMSFNINDEIETNSIKFNRKSSISSRSSSCLSPDDNEMKNIELNSNNKVNSGIVNASSTSFPQTIYDKIFNESHDVQEFRLKIISPYGKLKTFKSFNFIVKSGEDLRQEQFASQLINEFNQIFQIEKVHCYLYPYEILSTGTNSGIIEVVLDSISLDELKRKLQPGHSLKDFYEIYFKSSTYSYNKAIRNLIHSLAGYSLVCYFLQIKDRHNGNILINSKGHLIHIDFGFIFSHAPGNEFETAPFKLTDEIVNIIGGPKSKNFQKFRKLLWKGIIAISKHYEKIVILTEMMYCGNGNSLQCFERGQEAINELKLRFQPKDNMKPKDYLELIDKLIEQALLSWRTKWYDKYQYYFQGIFY